jgi:3-methylcrotonyl-CoA carboxylase beta subunit
MPKLISQIDENSAEFKARKQSMDALVVDLREKLTACANISDDQLIARHRAKGKLLPRERLAHLLDAGAPFLELSQLAAYEVYDENLPGAGAISGVGRINGVECMIVVNDSTIKVCNSFFKRISEYAKRKNLRRSKRNKK